jgi:hypothetical protein
MTIPIENLSVASRKWTLAVSIGSMLGAVAREDYRMAIAIPVGAYVMARAGARIDLIHEIGNTVLLGSTIFAAPGLLAEAVTSAVLSGMGNTLGNSLIKFAMGSLATLVTFRIIGQPLF